MNRLKINAVILLSTSIILSACAQLFMKAGMLQLHEVVNTNVSALGFVQENSEVFIWVVVGLFCYAISMLAWLFALVRYELSFAYPLLGLTYVLVYLGAVYWEQIGEELSWQRSVGIVLILIGVIFVNRKSSKDKVLNSSA